METTTTFYRTGNYKPDHTTFGGIISNGDFCTEYSQKPGEHIKDIISDWKFDEDCKKNAESRARRINHEKGIR